MNLDDITTAVRPRSAWEATDLGIVMARAWWWPLARAWLAVSLPVVLVLELVLYRYPLVALLVVWWLKPLWERPLLHILSQAFFGQVPTLRETLRAFPAMAGRQWFASLTWRRFSPTRSMDLPVIQLEDLKGRQRARRLGVLHRTASSGAGWLTVMGVHIEALLSLAVLALMVMLIPMGSDWSGGDVVMGDTLPTQHLYLWLSYGCMWLVAPFYAAAGFSLYLNRRIWLEGWDIEIGFHRLRRRLAGRPGGTAGVIAAVAVLCGGLAVAVPSDVMADDGGLDRQSVKAAIEGIMEHEDFNQQRTVRSLKGDWEWTSEEGDGESPSWLLEFASVMAEGVRLLLWVAVVIAVVMLVVRYRHWLTYARPLAEEAGGAPVMPESMFGLAVGRDSLPEDVVAEVRALWRQGHCRAALALLYRASLTVLMERDAYAFNEALTEGECLRLVNAGPSREISGYFTQLTRYWLALAYGHRAPDGEAMELLCRRWPEVFGEPAGENV